MPEPQAKVSSLTRLCKLLRYGASDVPYRKSKVFSGMSRFQSFILMPFPLSRLFAPIPFFVGNQERIRWSLYVQLLSLGQNDCFTSLVKWAEAWLLNRRSTNSPCHLIPKWYLVTLVSRRSLVIRVSRDTSQVSYDIPWSLVMPFRIS